MKTLTSSPSQTARIISDLPPHIAGLAARILSAHPGLTPFAVKTILMACASNRRPE